MVCIKLQQHLQVVKCVVVVVVIVVVVVVVVLLFWLPGHVFAFSR